MLEFKRHVMTIQQNIVQFKLHNRVFNRWIDAAVLSGALDLNESQRRDAKRVEWLPHPWDYLNPQQDITSKRMQMRMGIKTRSELLKEQGKDPERVDNEYAEERAREDELSLVFDSNAAVLSNSGVAHTTDPQTLGEEDDE